ncbi:hypothetical protein N7532_006742 [Penicillium argentinense]|uniref:Uncharacterized protein n=1 Tax=Penicillium argentinense TaxID=1131581 RepID=A0A9W9FGI6_9EURO|nr:uncharacterized protein N7532_006742 [Penicillium argentinense]KAJ5099741.1 hypothetical protein N7532_006742 [Penicillium argentinense]
MIMHLQGRKITENPDILRDLELASKLQEDFRKWVRNSVHTQNLKDLGLSTTLRFYPINYIYGEEPVIPEFTEPRRVREKSEVTIYYPPDVRALLGSNGARADAYTVGGTRMLSLAVLSKSLDMVEMMLEFGAHPNQCDLIDESTPLAHATHTPHPELIPIIHLLVIAGSSLSQGNVMAGILRAFSLDMVLKAVVQGGSFGFIGDEGGTALHSAALRNDRIVLWLVKNRMPLQTPFLANFFNMGIEINIKYNRGWTVLHEAISLGQTGVAIELIEQKKIRIDDFDQCGRTELHLAVRKRNMHIIQALLARGADINALRFAKGQPKNGSPLHFAVQETSAGMLDCFLGSGQRENPDLKDGCDKTLSQDVMLIPNGAVQGRIQALLLRKRSRP